MPTNRIKHLGTSASSWRSAWPLPRGAGGLADGPADEYAQELFPAWSPDGRKVAFVGNSKIYVANADGSGQRRLTRNTAQELSPAWSPDGRKIAFVGRGDSSLEVYVMNADGSEQRRLTRNAVRDGNPVWSPDGRSIAFESKWQVYVMNADGSGQRRRARTVRGHK